MSFQDDQVIMAASGRGLPLIGTVVTHIVGFCSTSTDTERRIQAIQQNTADMLEEQRVENERTRERQRDQLNTRLAETL